MTNSKQVAKILLSKKLTDEEKGERLRVLLPLEAFVPVVVLYTSDMAKTKSAKRALALAEAIQKRVLELIEKTPNP
jgi:hypothetical protein